MKLIYGFLNALLRSNIYKLPYTLIVYRHTHTETNTYTMCFNLFVFAVTFVNKAFHGIDNNRMQLAWNLILVANILKNTSMIITCFFCLLKNFRHHMRTNHLNSIELIFYSTNYDWWVTHIHKQRPNIAVLFDYFLWCE